MFRENKKYLQNQMFSFHSQLSGRKQKKLYQSAEYLFHELIFQKINESIFAPLYSDNGGRPNTPINILVSAMILMHHRGWTYKELFQHIDFDLLTRTAFGLTDID